MNKTLEIVGAVYTSQFLNKRNAIAVSFESAFGVANVGGESVASVFDGFWFFINYIKDS